MQLNDVKEIKTDRKLNLGKINPPSELTRDVRLDVMFIELDKLEPYALQARKIFDQEELQELASTITAHGVRSPLAVIRSSTEDNKFQIISGERRWRAARIAGLKRVPCIVNDNINSSQEIALIENIQRKDLTPIELLEGLESYVANYPNMSKEEAIRKLGMSKTHFYRILSLVSLMPEARRIALENQVPIEKLMQISRVDPEKQVWAINKEIQAKVDAKAAQSLSEAHARAMSKKSKILEIKIKKDQIETDANFFVLSDSNKANIVLLLKRFIVELEGGDCG